MVGIPTRGVQTLPAPKFLPVVRLHVVVRAVANHGSPLRAPVVTLRHLGALVSECTQVDLAAITRTLFARRFESIGCCSLASLATCTEQMVVHGGLRVCACAFGGTQAGTQRDAMGQGASSQAAALTHDDTPDGTMIKEGDVDCTIAKVSQGIVLEHSLWQISGSKGYLRGKDETLVLPVSIANLTRLTKQPFPLWVPTTHAKRLLKALQESYMHVDEPRAWGAGAFALKDFSGVSCEALLAALQTAQVQEDLYLIEFGMKMPWGVWKYGTFLPPCSPPFTHASR